MSHLVSDHASIVGGEGGVIPSRRRQNRAGIGWLLALPVAVWQICFFAVPLLFLLAISFWQVVNYRITPGFVVENWTRILSSAAYHRALLYTLQSATLTTVLSLLVALPTAYTIAFGMAPRLRNLLIACLTIPVFSSYLLRVYAWQIVLSPKGIVNSLLGSLGLDPVPLLGTQLAMQIGLLTVTLPLTILVLVFAMTGIDRTLLNAARNLGATPRAVALNVVLPSIKPGLALASATAFILAFSDFVSPLFMTGSQPPTLSILIVDTVKSGAQWPRASVIGLTMLLVVGILLALVGLLARSRGGRSS